MVGIIAQVLKAIVELKGVRPPDAVKSVVEAVDNVTDTARSIAVSLINNSPASVFLGNLTQHHPQYSVIHVLAQHIAQISEASFGVLGEAANSVGGYLAGAVPVSSSLGTSSNSGYNASQMLRMNVGTPTIAPCQAYVLLNIEPELDAYNPQAAMKTLDAAELVVMMSTYKIGASTCVDYADVMLPIAPFTETSGTFINTEGRAQSFNGVVAPLGDTRPAWKILRVLGNLLQLEGFDFETPEQVYAEVIPPGTDIRKLLDNKLKSFTVSELKQENYGIQRIGEVPIYQTDPIVRRAESLQLTRDATVPVAWMSGLLLEKLGVSVGDKVELKQGEGKACLQAACDDNLPSNCVRLVSAHPLTAALGDMFGEITVKKL
jgi:NADH-quinone oxidoreductase subunit G